MFTLGFFFGMSWEMHHCGPIEGSAAENQVVGCGRMVSAGPQRGKGEGIMNENVDSMMIRLVGLALAVLLMAGMTIYTDLFKKTSDMDARATVISVQDGHVAAEDVQWNA